MSKGTRDEEIQTIRNAKYHIVIIGAGASYAAFPDGDKNGKELPLMNNLIEILKLQDIIKPTDLKLNNRNFEEIYNFLYQNKKFYDIRKRTEQKVYNYFADFEIHKKPTLYDYLLLSLREKDLVATFNWDPLLVQAYRRHIQFIDLPHLIFLHGNVTVGYCKDHKFKGDIYANCPYCHKKLSPTPLLYPITEKNYGENEFISAEWKTLQNYLENAFIITIFGYSAPKSDIKAVKLMTEVWGDPENRKLEQIEIIDIKSEDELRNTWSDFIYSHHYYVRNNFFDSWIANHPRRTYEAYFSQEFEIKFIENNLIPRYNSLDELRNWFAELYQVELDSKNQLFQSIAKEIQKLYNIIEKNAKNSEITIPKSFQILPAILKKIQEKNYRKVYSLLKSINPLEINQLKDQMDISQKQIVIQILKDLGFKNLPTDF